MWGLVVWEVWLVTPHAQPPDLPVLISEVLPGTCSWYGRMRVS